ncbi:hypothetical protein B0T24DRAFT_633690 [Lasiosphaeria ovina]|uniref:Uncharacterized protein n=1 Tax=Lasiosphaeria ovina TaxID=92902 RepID=A0AAE0N1M3_9PEZI|nr:hypothetical protein B0T24DRAFT_633690 [Lasiosphaeria ovina]
MWRPFSSSLVCGSLRGMRVSHFAAVSGCQNRYALALARLATLPRRGFLTKREVSVLASADAEGGVVVPKENPNASHPRTFTKKDPRPQDIQIFLSLGDCGVRSIESSPRGPARNSHTHIAPTDGHTLGRPVLLASKCRQVGLGRNQAVYDLGSQHVVARRDDMMMTGDGRP